MVFVGQGTYGCVYRPPLFCKDGMQVPPGKISKLMTDADAKKEVDEYKVIEKIDPNDKYYPGKPMKCKADPADIIKSVKTSDCDVYADNPKPDKYSLLFYDDGGIDLGKFVKNELTQYLAKGPEQVDLFFKHAHNLFKGLHLYAQNNFLHHDIKPGNIVFEPSTYTFKYIDFGLSAKSDKLIQDMIAQKDSERFHWSYPLEFGFTHPDSPYFYSTLSVGQLNRMNADLKKIFKGTYGRASPFLIKASSYQNVFDYIKDVAFGEKNDSIINQFVDGWHDGFEQALQSNMPYSEFVKKSVLSVDTYSLGFTMNHMINAFYQKGAMRKEMYYDFRALFQKMWNPNFMERISDTKMLLNMYEQVLVKTGIMYRAQSVFENHEIKNINDVSTKTPTPSSLPNLIPLELLKPVKQQKKRCPKGTRKNKKTGDCEVKPKHKEQMSQSPIISMPIENPATPLTPPPVSVKPATPLTPPPVSVKRAVKRCPNGTRKNKKTGLCEPK